MCGEGSDLRCCLLGGLDVHIGNDHASGALFGEGVAACLTDPACCEMGQNSMSTQSRKAEEKVNLPPPVTNAYPLTSSILGYL